MLILFGSIYGNEPTPLFGGRGMVDVSVPAYMGLIIVTVGLMSVPIQTASSREAGVLRRYQATPLRPMAYLIANVAGNYGMALLGILLLLLVGKVGYNVQFDGNVPSVLGGGTLGTLAFFALGYLVASLAPTARIAQTVGMVLAFPMMFLSGATIPLETMPESVRNVSRFIPLTHVVTLLQGLWFGEGWGEHLTEIIVLVGTLGIGTAVAARLFRWE